MHSYFGKWVASYVFVINFADFAFFAKVLSIFVNFLSNFFILNVDERRNCSFGGRLYSGSHWVCHDRLLDRFWSQPHSFKFHTFWATYWNFAPRCSFVFHIFIFFGYGCQGFSIFLVSSFLAQTIGESPQSFHCTTCPNFSSNPNFYLLLSSCILYILTLHPRWSTLTSLLHSDIQVSISFKS